MPISARHAASGKITTPYVIPAAMVMVGVQLMEQAVSREAVAVWLRELAEQYDQTGYIDLAGSG